jgi:hypothetical protein
VVTNVDINTHTYIYIFANSLGDLNYTMKTCDVILLVFLLSRVAWLYQIV